MTATFDAPLMSSNNQVIATDTVLLAAGDESIAGVDLTTGALRWSVPRAKAANACSAIALSELTGRFYCRLTYATSSRQNSNRIGRLDEHSLATGQPTGVVLDPQLGTVGDVAVSADGRELVTFSHNTSVISRWRLDGSGPVTTRLGEGRIGARYDPTGSLLLVNRPGDAPYYASEFRAGGGDRYVVDVATGGIVDPLDGLGGEAWAGPPGLLAATFDGTTGGFYDLDNRARVDGFDFEIDGQISFASDPVAGRRVYVGFVDGRARTLDATQGWVGPTIEIKTGAIGSISATTDGSRVVITTTADGASGG